MIFQHTHAWITGTSPHTGQPKTQTSRLAAGYQVGPTCVTKNGRTLWQLGGDYAVQPARGQRAVGRIRLTSIRTADVRTFTQADAQREGFANVAGFFYVWTLMHDFTVRMQDVTEERWREVLATRPFDRYFAVVLEFEAG
jgi:hypothetical protein